MELKQSLKSRFGRQRIKNSKTFLTAYFRLIESSEISLFLKTFLNFPFAKNVFRTDLLSIRN